MDFIRGFVCTLLYWVVGILGFILLVMAGIHAELYLAIIALICFAIAGALKYWQGKIVRIR